MELEYRLPHVIHIDIIKYNAEHRKEMWHWCKHTFGNERETWSWDSTHTQLDIFYFNEEKHATMFLLKWG